MIISLALDALIKNVHAVRVYRSAKVICALYCMFAYDARAFADSGDAINAIDGISILSLAFFSIDVLGSWIWDPLYAFSMRALLDIALNAALSLNIPPITSGLSDRIADAGPDSARILVFIHSLQKIRVLDILRVGQAAFPRVGKVPPTISAPVLETHAKSRKFHHRRPPVKPRDNQLGRALARMTVGCVCGLVLVCLLVLPELHATEKGSREWDLNEVRSACEFFQSSAGSQTAWAVYLSAFTVFKARYGIRGSGESACGDSEWNPSVLSSPYAPNEVRPLLCTVAILGLVVLVTEFFQNENAYRGVLYPINSMMDKVDRIRQDPLARFDESRKTDMERITRTARLNTATSFAGRWRAKRELTRVAESSLETVMLEKTIVRIGGLLAVGFGQAGAKIVAQNMSNESSMDVHAMVPGRRIGAIFGHIGIENFSVLTSVLQHRVMLFVNQICDIVHGIVDEFHGISNPSNGDSFLVVWKLDDPPPAFPEPFSRYSQTHDMAVAACVKILIALGRSIELSEYGLLPSLKQKIPNFKVALSFGLHKGWAIEGAIGSNLKIDPNYLSPDVNVAEVLQLANAQFGTVILASKALVSSCSEGMQVMFRQIDCLQLHSARDPIQVHSLDLDFHRQLLSRYEAEHAIMTGARTQGTCISKSRIQTDRDRRKENRWRANIPEDLHKDKLFRLLRHPFVRDGLFLQQFKSGLLNYECAEWEIARDAFAQTMHALVREIEENVEDRVEGLKPLVSYEQLSDGPSMFLHAFMKKTNFIPPTKWKGVRELYENQSKALSRT